MKLNKTIITAASIVVLVVCGFFMSRSCASDSRLRELILQYEGYKAIAEADHQMSLDRISQLNKDLVSRDENILKLEEVITQKNAKIITLTTKLSDIQNAEPVQPELENEPLVKNLRYQIATLKEMFSLATETINDKDDIIREWEAKFATQVKITLEWKADYDREHTLRLASEKLAGELYKSQKKAKFYNKAAVVAIAGAVAYGLLK